MMSATPTTIGDTRERQVDDGLEQARPRKRPRTRASAVATPKTTLIGTVIATMSSDRLRADWAAGVDTDVRKAGMPGAKVRQRMTAMGTPTRTNR